MEIDQLLTATRSARRSLDLETPVDLDEIRGCLRTGLQAPSGSNQQSWRWLVVTDQALRDRIADLYRAAYLGKVGGQLIAGFMPSGTPEAKLMSSTEWLVENLAEGAGVGDPMLRAHDAEGRRRRILLSGNSLRIDLPCRLELSACAARTWLWDLHHDTAPALRTYSARTARDTRVVHPGLSVTRRAAADRTHIRTGTTPKNR